MQKFNFMVFSNMILMFFFFMMLEEHGPISKNFFFDNFNFFIMFMSLIILYIINLMNFNNMNNFNIISFNMMLIVNFSLVFFCSNFFLFYIFFEISVIPLMLLISSWGYSLERFKAMMYMFIYTTLMSLPFLFILLFLNSENQSINLVYLKFSNNFNYQFFLILYLFLFMMKLPIWGFHFWLPKAHVEASTEGSMILAAIVLKMGGMGLIKFSYMIFNISNTNLLNSFFLSLSILGVLIMAINCTRSVDSKMIVALSSVVHMSFCLILFFYNSTMCSISMLMIMIAHGFISPLMFFFLSNLYSMNMSRSILMNKGMLKNFKYIKSLWFLLCILNMGMPLSLNFISEFFSLVCIKIFSVISLFCIVFTIFNSGLYNMYLYTFFSTSNMNNNMYIYNIMKNNIFNYPIILMMFLFFFFMMEM